MTSSTVDSKFVRRPATEAELGWFAGIWEGEGCIILAKHTNKKDFYTKASITNTDLTLLEKSIEILLNCGLEWHLRLKKTYSDKHKQAYSLECSSRPTLRHSLITFIPYMYGQKKTKAEEVLDFINMRRGKGPGHPYTPEELAITEKYERVAKAA